VEAARAGLVPKLPDIPEQSGAGEFKETNNRLDLSLQRPASDPPLSTRSNVFLEELRDAARELAGSFPESSNAHASLRTVALRYLALVEIDNPDVDLVFARGLRLESAAEADTRDIKNKLEEELEDSSKRALDSVLKLHAVFIATDPVGQELLNAVDRYNRPLEEDLKVKAAVEPIVDRLAIPDLSRPEAIDALKSAPALIQDPRRHERTGFVGTATINSAMSFLFKAAVAGIVGKIAGEIVWQFPEAKQLVAVSPQYARMALNFILDNAIALKELAAVSRDSFGWMNSAIEWLKDKMARLGDVI
jgi:hypothetical protein